MHDLHEFTYGFCGTNDIRIENINKNNILFNYTPIAVNAKEMKPFIDIKHEGCCLVQVSCLKASEDRNGLILRVVEVGGGRGSINICIPSIKIKKMHISNIMEEKISEINHIPYLYNIKPFEIATFYIE